MLELAIQEFCKRFQLPGIFRVIDWHRAVREFFIPVDRADSFETTFMHADEIEIFMGLLLFDKMLDMSKAEEAWPANFFPGGHMDVSVDAYRRPCRWSEGQGHSAIELKGIPQGIVGNSPSVGTIYPAQILAGLSQGLLFSYCTSEAMKYVPSDKKSTAMGFYQSLYAIGIMFMPIIAGAIAENEVYAGTATVKSALAV